jgi:sugar phosphate isomerase/epimerase
MKKQALLSLSMLALYATLFVGCNQRMLTSSNERLTEKPAIYVQLYSVREDVKNDFNSTIQNVADIGYTGVEAAGYKDGKFYDLTPEEFKHKIEGAGMKLLSSHAGRSLNRENPANTNWESIWKWWDTAITAHKAAGIEYLITASMPRLTSLEHLKVYCDYYNEIGRKCKEQGIRFGYHNHAFEYVEFDGVTWYDYMIENTDPDLVFYQMDVYWTVKGGKSPVEYFKKYPGRFEILHIKDEKELGESGMVGFDAILKNRAIAGTKHLVIEIEKYEFPPMQSIKLGYDYLVEILSEKNE